MMRQNGFFLVVAILLILLAVGVGRSEEKASLFAPSNLRTASGALADPDSFFEAADCGECHVDQYAAWKGSAHSRAHHDSIYRAFADMAREEGGDELYVFCSSCHAPLAVATGEIPRSKTLTHLSDDGVSCEVCHGIKEITPTHLGAGSNASIVLEEGDIRYGPIAKSTETSAHESAGTDIHDKAEFCSACHTLIHPHSGLVIENTYEEWKKGPYAKAGIQCQDCHMRTVDQALEVAKTMKPLLVPGRTAEDEEPRPDVKAHLFVGANANGRLLGLDEAHTSEAEKRLQTSVALALELPAGAAAGSKAKLVVAVTNVAAGHAIPTSITELRQVWIDLSVTDAAGKEILHSGAVDETGRVDPEAVMYHSVLHDKDGKVTFKPWLAVKMVKEKLIGPKETVRESYELPIPAGVKGPLKVRAVLRYRSAPQDVMDRLFGKGKYVIRTIDMATAEGTLALP